MSIRVSNNATSRLVTAISAGDTTISIMAGTGGRFPELGTGDWFPLTAFNASGQVEIMRCTARAGDSLTVERGKENTAAMAWPADTPIEIRVTAGIVEAMQSRFTVSTAAPSGGVNGDVWFQP